MTDRDVLAAFQPIRRTVFALDIGLLMPALAAVLLLGCAARQPARPVSDRPAVQAAVDRYVNASNRGDAEALSALYADDAILLPPDHEPVEGRRAIGEFWRQGTDSGLAYAVGRYTLPPTDQEPADSGKYVTCLKRQPDGSWKVSADIWNASGGDDDASEDADRRPRQTVTVRGSIPSAEERRPGTRA